MRILSETGDPDAPIGSRPWAIAVRSDAFRAKRDSANAVRGIKSTILMLRKDDRFKELSDERDRPFIAWEDFVQYREPFGLGLRMDVVAAILAEPNENTTLKDVIAKAAALGKAVERGEIRVPMSAKEKQTLATTAATLARTAASNENNDRRDKMENVPTVDGLDSDRGDNLENVPTDQRRGNSAAHRTARLKREHPEIVARQAAGEFKSVRDAERAAGLNVPSLLTPAQKLWRHVERTWPALSADERVEFFTRMASLRGSDTAS